MNSVSPCCLLYSIIAGTVVDIVIACGGTLEDAPNTGWEVEFEFSDGPCKISVAKGNVIDEDDGLYFGVGGGVSSK